MKKERIYLNGEWDFMPVYGVKACLDLPQNMHFEKEKIHVPSSWRYVIPEDMPYCNEGFGIVDGFQPFNLFEYPQEWSRAETGVYKKLFSMPERNQEVKKSAERIFLNFDGIMQQSRIYLNNQIVADWDEAYLPLKVDVTKYMKADAMENELIVVCTTFDETQTKSGSTKSLGLLGSWFGYLGRGIWQDVFIETTSHILIEDAFIKTSVRNKEIAVDVEVVSHQNEVHMMTIIIEILDESGTVLSFKPQIIELDALSKKSFQISEQWINPKLWSFETPFLYTMQIVLCSESEEFDRKSIVFGFREIWTESNQFILNGIRINLRGDSWHFQGAIQQTKTYATNWFKMCKEKGLNFVRLHANPHPAYYLEAADEVGIMIVDETAIYGSAKTMDASHPVYIKRCKEHIERLVKRDRNHPSIIMWSLQNEMRWVDGRDDFKKQIPGLMKSIRQLDGSRPIIVEGDNRLLPKKNTEIESYHYNIDGTLMQWDKERPLVYGEHGGWWYICPQNFSAYSGLDAYLSWENSSIGAALKEKLYVEDSRRNEVSGITSFNFAHYLMKSMPNEDVSLTWKDQNSPGCQPKVIRKHALTINNGYLKDYPKYIPNVAMDTLQEAYKVAAIIPVEYNTAFFDDSLIERNFDVYNDTMKSVKARVDIRLVTNSGQEVYKEIIEFMQEPGEKKRVTIAFMPPTTIDKTILLLTAVLYHEALEIKHSFQKSYNLYSAGLKKSVLEVNEKNIAFWGSDTDYRSLTELLPYCKRLTSVFEIDKNAYDVLIIGSHVNSSAEAFHKCLERYVGKGGCLVVLEQTKFTVGELTLFKKDFFSAQINDATHQVLEGLTEVDFSFWKPNVHEGRPEAIIEDCYNKPMSGDVEFILEASDGDFGDGGSLWSPLFLYKYGYGTMIFNQLELMTNYQNIPQACVLLRNILKYALNQKIRVNAETAVLSDLEGDHLTFLKSTGLCFDQLGVQECLEKNCLGKYKNLIIDANSFYDEMLEPLISFMNRGGCVLVLPLDANHQPYLEKLLKCKVEIENEPVYQLKKSRVHKLTSGISIFDTFRFEKVNFSPRMVENVVICENTIEIEGQNNLLESNNGTPWYDFYVRGIADEYARVALVDMNRIHRKKNKSYFVEKEVGKGSFILSQISTDARYEKNIRVYSRILSNLGAWLLNDFFSYYKGDRDYAVPYMMTIHHEAYKEYGAAEAYFSDENYTLNNLGEGVYGWMKKVEKESKDGFITIPKSKGTTYFTTCFVNLERDKCKKSDQPQSLSCRLEVSTNCSFKVWVNGVFMKAYSHKQQLEGPVIVQDVMLKKGLNRFVLIGKCDEEDMKVRSVFKGIDGNYLDCLKYTATMDEVDPK